MRDSFCTTTSRTNHLHQHERAHEYECNVHKYTMNRRLQVLVHMRYDHRFCAPPDQRGGGGGPRPPEPGPLHEGPVFVCRRFAPPRPPPYLAAYPLDGCLAGGCDEPRPRPPPPGPLQPPRPPLEPMLNVVGAREKSTSIRAFFGHSLAMCPRSPQWKHEKSGAVPPPKPRRAWTHDESRWPSPPQRQQLGKPGGIESCGAQHKCPLEPHT